MTPSKKLNGRVLATLILESLLAFVVVAVLSLAVRFVYMKEKPSEVAVSDNALIQQPGRESALQAASEITEELRYNPARTSAYVKSAYAAVTASAKSDAAVLDHIPFGSLVDLGGWDAGRKFVKIKATPSTSGYVSIRELTYEDPAPLIFGSGAESSGVQTWKRRFLGDLRRGAASSVDRALDVDASVNGLRSQKSLSEFFRALKDIPSKSHFDADQTAVSYSFLARDLDGKDGLIYPRMPLFIARLKNQDPGPGLLFESGLDHSGPGVFEIEPTQPLKLRLTKEPLGLMVRPLQELSNVGLSAFNVPCQGDKCALHFDSLPSQGSTALSAIVMGKVERIKPTMEIKQSDSGDAWMGFLDIDGDRQYDAAIYVGQRFADVLTPGTVYVAENHFGSWRLKYIKDDVVGRDSPQVSVEPGSHTMPINVRLYSDGDFGIAYTLDGSEPVCTSSKPLKAIVREAEFLIEQSTSIKAMACWSGQKNPPIMTFNYDVKK
jgi:hypothetical protein